MSLKLGNTPIAGISTHTNVNAHSLFDFKWSDHKLNEISWLEASTFSWQSGDVYVTTYNHLVQDLQDTTAETETIGSYTVTFYRATDGHKICLADQETIIANIYSETGIAWYYILDTTNTQFKLPRTKFGFEGLRTNVGDKIDESLPNIKGWFDIVNTTSKDEVLFKSIGSGNNSGATGGGTMRMQYNANRYNSTYQDNAPVQERATQMYLYFYVGDYTQTAIEQTAGLNAELFNGKVDKSDLQEVQCVVETYSNGTSWYRVWSDGWCEQGGRTTGSSSGRFTINFLKTLKDSTMFYPTLQIVDSTQLDNHTTGSYVYSHTTSSMVCGAVYFRSGTPAYLSLPVVWKVEGYIEV